MEMLLQTIVLLFLGFTVFFLVWSLFRFPVPDEPPIHRVIAVRLGQGQRTTVFEQRTFAPIVSLVMSMTRRIAFPGLRDLIRRNLNGAGNPNNYSTDEYMTLCILVALVLGLVGSVFAAMLMGVAAAPYVALMLLMVGFCIPLLALHQACSQRVLRISRQIPYTLDLIALMMAAGATFTEAIETLIHDDPDDDINQELRVVQAEIEFGTPRAAALSNMAERIPLESLRSVIGAINQAEALGTPLSTILKSQSSMIRMHRSVRAEKLAASASLRILIPSLLIMIAVIVIVFGPIIVNWAKSGFRMSPQ